MSNKTTTQLNSCTPQTCTCTDLWSISQKFCLQRLSNSSGGNTYTYISSKSSRARRIAGTYARLYLEIEKDGGHSIGNTSKVGRFYWMALGAFASKTVACTLEHWTLNLVSKNINWLVSAEDWFGQGNFWLFQDIAGWHHHYSSYGSKVFFKCVESRSTDNLVPQMKVAINNAPWAPQSIPKINNLRSNSFIVKGFRKVSDFESSTDSDERKGFQLANVVEIAQHEQKMVLQPLIYSKTRNIREINVMGMPVIRDFAPEVSLFFSSDCKIPQVRADSGYHYRGNPRKYKNDPNYEKYVSKPDSDIILYDYNSRMKWIDQAAKKFHGLMQSEKTYMHNQLKTMASWYNKADL